MARDYLSAMKQNIRSLSASLSRSLSHSLSLARSLFLGIGAQTASLSRSLSLSLSLSYVVDLSMHVGLPVITPFCCFSVGFAALSLSFPFVCEVLDMSEL